MVEVVVIAGVSTIAMNHCAVFDRFGLGGGGYGSSGYGGGYGGSGGGYGGGNYPQGGYGQ